MKQIRLEIYHNYKLVFRYEIIDQNSLQEAAGVFAFRVRNIEPNSDNPKSLIDAFIKQHTIAQSANILHQYSTFGFLVKFNIIPERVIFEDHTKSHKKLLNLPLGNDNRLFYKLVMIDENQQPTKTIVSWTQNAKDHIDYTAFKAIHNYEFVDQEFVKKLVSNISAPGNYWVTNTHKLLVSAIPFFEDNISYKETIERLDKLITELNETWLKLQSIKP